MECDAGARAGCLGPAARARGAGTPQPNPEVPADWSPQRSRPLCAWPRVARYVGGDPEQAASFACRAS